MGTISYTIGQHKEDICTDIIFDSKLEAMNEAICHNSLAFKFEWDGIDAQSIINVEEL